MTEKQLERISAVGLTEAEFGINQGMTINEKLAIIAESVSVDESKKDSDEVQTKAFYNPQTRVIEYMDSGFRFGKGTDTEPMQYVTGDAVTKGVCYCLYKYDGKNYYPQLTNGTYKAIADCVPSKFGAMTAFEKLW